MKAAIKRLQLVDEDFSTFVPASVKNYCVVVEIGIGPLDQEGYDNFSLHVCSLDWLKLNESDSPSFCRHVLIMSTYNKVEIEELIGSIVRKVERETWLELAHFFSRYFRWEFEDYSLVLSEVPSFPYTMRLR